ncbi:putative lipoprotein LpqN [Mycobacterium basiliense]|uniref:Putative lipoprotein LpqN n=1 Tax=Mycobacterium basiliense TaxID=2094119 RepID=A0A447G7R1_9MYCO|nr:LpqN/LpqT family lipoprotein [Mycobacterium basiliense]VDM86538.1 putative lipoprotein LpqN [Mycobacterium basiliense]
MIRIARTLRVFAGGIAAGVIGVMVIAGGKASAEPLIPQPPAPAPVPAQSTTPPVQNLTAVPGGVSNRFSPAPAPVPVQAPIATSAPIPAAVPATGSAPAAAVPLPPSVTPATTGTLREYLQDKGVKLEAQRPEGFKALDIVLPMPPRWTQVPDPNVPDAFAVIADRVGGNSVYTSNAQVVVYRLLGDFDATEAISHGFVESQKLLAWRTTNASMANFAGFPSSIIEGTFRENDMTLNTSRRHVLASAGADRYLVSLSVTTALSQAVADGPATDAIINGFRVSVPAAQGHAPARPGAASTAPVAPVQAPAPVTTHPAPVAAPAQVPPHAPAPNLNTAVQSVPGTASALPPLATLTPAPSH